MCSSYKLRHIGMGKDTVVGINFQTDTQDHWRGRLQGLTETDTPILSAPAPLLNGQLLNLKSALIGSVFLFQGVRDLLKTVLDKIQTIPLTVSSAIVQQLLAAREVFTYGIIILEFVFCMNS